MPDKEIKTAGDLFQAAKEFKNTREAVDALSNQKTSIIFAGKKKDKDDEGIYEGAVDRDPESGKYIIRIDTEIDKEMQSKLNPSSDEFDFEMYKEHATAALQRLKTLLDDMHDGIVDAMKNTLGESAFISFAEVLQSVLEPVAETVNEKVVSDKFRKIAETLESIEANEATMRERTKELDTLRPYLEEELKKPEYNGITFDELIALEENEENNAIIEKAFSAAMATRTTLQAQNGSSLPSVNKPNNYTMMNSKIVNKYIALQDLLTVLDSDGQMTFLPIEHNENAVAMTIKDATPKQKVVVDIVSLTYTGDLDGKTAKIKRYDQSVYDSVASLVQAGNRRFYLDDIYKLLTQKTKVTEAGLNRIKQSLNKFASTRIRLDITEEIKAGLIKLDDANITQDVIEDNLLHARIYTMTTDKGAVKEVVELLAEPLLLAYSKAKGNGQLITIPVDLLTIEGKATEETICIRDYLLKEINQLKKGYRDNSVVNYENLLKNVGIEESSLTRTEKNRITTTICSLLDNWRDKDHIKGYSIRNGQRNKVLGFKIEV